jgi:transposase, IS30 family
MQYKHFSIEEREVLQKLWWERRSVRHIATEIGRSPSSVSRELRRNFPPEYKVYTPRLAHERALKKRKSRGREERLKNDRIRSYVVRHLKKRWSPEQIAGRMKTDLNETISHEAIYQFIYAQIHRNGYGWVKPGKEDLRPYLRRKQKRRIHKGTRRCQRIFKPQGISIDARPRIVEKRTRVGDWESDTVESKDHKPGINTLVERKTGIVCISKLADKTSAATSVTIVRRMRALPERARQTMTFDNGPENSAWQAIEDAVDIGCFFAHAYHSWERGTNENTNGLIRDYYPKKTDFTLVPDEEIAVVEHELNTRPRKRLGWRTPLEVFSVALQS